MEAAMNSSAQTQKLLRGRTRWRASSARRHRDARDAERRLRVMEAVGDMTMAQLPLNALLQALLDSVRREMALESVAILLVNDDGATVTAHTASGSGSEIAESVRLPVGQGITGEAMLSHQPIYISNQRELLARSPYFTGELRVRVNLQSAIIAPLMLTNHPIGALIVISNEPDHFTPADIRLVGLIGARAALAIEQARANDEAAQAHERLRFLNDMGGALSATLNYRESTQRLADFLTPTLGAACAIYLLEVDGLLRKETTRSPAWQRPDDPLAAALERVVAQLPPTIEPRPGAPDCAISGCVAALTPVFERAMLVAGDGATAEVSTSSVSVPLVVRGHALGALYLVASPGKEFTAGDMALLHGIAERAAVAIDNARLYLETEEARASGSATATQLDTIFNATDVGICVTDTHGAYLRINPYGVDLLGLADASEVRGDTQDLPFELRTPEGEVIPLEREPLRLARTLGQPIEQRVIIHRRRRAKDDVEALIRCTPWRDRRNQIAGAIGVFTDITEISALERQKDEFLGIASHELKTPLTSLKIIAQLLGRKLTTSGDTRDQEQAKLMQHSITRMEQLISDLLDVSLIQEGRLALNQRVTDLNTICADAVSEQRLLSQRQITFSGPDGQPLLVYADAERIYQVITHLLSNALKYSPATEAVAVQARIAGGECVVSVSDHGSGVPPEALNHIFDRFYRVPGMQVQSGSGVGLGLGLNISHEIITRHGGRIWVESTLGHGSVFFFALPRVASQ